MGAVRSCNLYTLRPILADGVSSDSAKAGELGLVVGAVDLPRFLGQPQIATRVGPSKIVYDEYHRWGQSLHSNFSQVLADNLATLLDTRRIVVYPAGAPFPVTYRVLVDVQEFTADQDGVVSLRARWTVVPGKGGDALAVEQTSVRTPPAGDVHDAVVSAHSDALAELSRSIAARIRGLQAGGPEH